MNAVSGPELTIQDKVRRFYDIGSPYYVSLFGRHIHDGYYLTGKESREVAQENLIQLLAEKAAIKKGSRILDAGCGIGGSSIWLAENLAATTVGITLSPVQLEIARRLARERAVNSTFLLMDAGKMEFAEPFDVVWVLAALTHFPDQKRFFESVYRYLKPGGKLAIYDWTAAEALSNAGNDPDVRRVIEGMVLANLYSANTYARWLTDAGFTGVHIADITDRTIRTWDINLSLVRKSLLRNLLIAITHSELKEVNLFLKGRRAIKHAMIKNKVRSTVLIAEKAGF